MDIQNQKNELLKLLRCPITHETFTQNSNYPANENGIISFLNEKLYVSNEAYLNTLHTIEYWNKGWQKRLREEDHAFLYELKRAELLTYAEKRIKRFKEKKGCGTLFSTEVDFQTLKDKICLNIGCGAGVEALILLSQGARGCIAMDLTPAASEAALKIMDKIGVGIGIQADARHIPLATNSIDVVYSSGVLHHSDQIEKSIQEVFRVLKPGGVAYIGLYSSSSLSFNWIKLKGFITHQFSKKIRNNYLSQHTEVDWQVSQSRNPYTELFSKNKINKLFSSFSELKIRKGGFFWSQVPLFGKMLSPLLTTHEESTIKWLQKLENSPLLAPFGMGIYMAAKK